MTQEELIELLHCEARADRLTVLVDHHNDVHEYVAAAIEDGESGVLLLLDSFFDDEDDDIPPRVAGKITPSSTPEDAEDT